MLGTLLLLAGSAGCFEPGLDVSCSPREAGRELLSVHVAWNATGEPVPGAWVVARSDAGDACARTGRDGTTVLALAPGPWTVVASLSDPDDRYCALQARASASVPGMGPLQLRLDDSPKVCA